MTKLQMLNEMDRCFKMALEGKLSAAEKRSLDTRFYEMIVHLQASEVKSSNHAVLAQMKWAK
jgi:hypothetical protein